MSKYVLGVDIGSGSVKITLLDSSGKISGTAMCEYPTHHPMVGWCEQDPEDWCKAFKTALSDLTLKLGIKGEDIAALAPDAATHTAVLLDENKAVLRHAILWTDQRSREEVALLKSTVLDLLRSRTFNAPTTVWTLPQFMWLQKHEKELYSRARYVLFAKDYLRFRLTDELYTDYIDAAGSMFYDVQKKAWDDELCGLCGLDPAILPPVIAPSQLAGRVTKEAAEFFGLAEGTPVFAGTTDTVMEVLAAGGTKLTDTTVKLATAGRICVICDKPLDSQFIFNYPHVVDGLWYPGTGTASCANSYRWYRDVLGRDDYKLLDEGAEKVAPGCEGLMFHPYLNGELTPYNDSKLRGSFAGISAGHRLEHFTRATLEGVAFSLRDCMDVLDDLQVSMGRIRIIGGGAKGLLWRQIVSDVLGKSLEKVKVDDSSFGSAMLAAVGLGWFSDFTAAAEACVEIESVTHPNPENQKIYNEIFPRYRKIHDALAPIYQDL